MQSRGFLCDAALAAGHDLGVFEALARTGPLSLDQLAAALGITAGHRRLSALLDVLAALGAITHDAGPALPRFGASSLAPPHPVVSRAGWGLLADVIRSDRPLPIEGGEAERRLHAHLASAGAAAAAELAAMLGANSLLDLGSGAGAYSLAFLRAQPAGRATLVDTPGTLALAVERLGPLGDRARFVEGDASVVDAGTGYGAVLLANLLHLHSPAMCARLCVAAARAVAPDGMVVIKDLRVDDDRAGPLAGLLFALNMAIYTEAGDVYSTSQLRSWLASAGLVDIVERRLAVAPDAIVVIGRPARKADVGAADRLQAGAGVGLEIEVRGVPDPASESETKTETGSRTESGTGSGTESGTGSRTESGTGAGSGTETGLEAEPAAEAVAAELDAALARTAAQAWRALAASPADATRVPALAFPAPLRRFLAAAVALERSDGGGERADQLVRHYTDAMPRMRIAQLAGTDEPGATLFHTPLDWDHLPRLGAAIDRLFATLADAGVEPVRALGARSAGAFRARTPTLAALYERTHYGGFMPLLYGFPADLTYIHARGTADGLGVPAIIDRYLTAPIVHELCHFAPDRAAIAPPHLDECLAGWLGVYVHPELAYPTGDHDDALYAAPWLAQVGQAIGRAFGIRSVVRAHAGGDLAALPRDFITTAARLGWDDWCARRTLHFLSDTFDPAPWIALAVASGAGRSVAEASVASLAAVPLRGLELPADPEFDRAIVEDALRAMCLTSSQVAGSFRTCTRLPAGSIAIDALACSVIADRRGELDPVAPRYWLPPAVATRIIARGRSGYLLELATIAAIPEAAAAICDASPAADRTGFSLAPRAA